MFWELNYINVILNAKNVFNGLHKLCEVSIIGDAFSLPLRTIDVCRTCPEDTVCNMWHFCGTLTWL